MPEPDARKTRLTWAARQARERGATTAEVAEAIRKGAREPAKQGRELCRYNFTFVRKWQGKQYAIKQVAPVIALLANQIRQIAKDEIAPARHIMAAEIKELSGQSAGGIF